MPRPWGLWHAVGDGSHPPALRGHGSAMRGRLVGHGSTSHPTVPRAQAVWREGVVTHTPAPGVLGQAARAVGVMTSADSY